jgi:hypothetical protein
MGLQHFLSLLTFENTPEVRICSTELAEAYLVGQRRGENVREMATLIRLKLISWKKMA